MNFVKRFKEVSNIVDNEYGYVFKKVADKINKNSDLNKDYEEGELLLCFQRIGESAVALVFNSWDVEEGKALFVVGF